MGHYLPSIQTVKPVKLRNENNRWHYSFKIQVTLIYTINKDNMDFKTVLSSVIFTSKFDWLAKGNTSKQSRATVTMK